MNEARKTRMLARGYLAAVLSVLTILAADSVAGTALQEAQRQPATTAYLFAENATLKAFLRVKNPASLADEDWMQVEFVNSGRPAAVKSFGIEISAECYSCGYGGNYPIAGVGNEPAWKRLPLLLPWLKEGSQTIGNLSGEAGSVLGAPKGNANVALHVQLELSLDDGRSLRTNSMKPMTMTWRPPTRAEVEVLQNQAVGLFTRVTHTVSKDNAGDADLARLRSLLKPPMSDKITLEQGLAALKQRQVENGSLRLLSLAYFVWGRWGKDPALITFYREALAERGCIAMDFGASKDTWDTTLIEPIIRALETQGCVNPGIDILNAHYTAWQNDPSIPPRLSKAVLQAHPLEIDAQNDEFYTAAMRLTETHDRAMIDVLRPYLKDTAIDGFTSHSSNMPSDATPLRHKDLAANAILTLLGEPEMVNPHSRASLPAGSRRGGRGSPGPGAESAEPYPEWLVWDKKIGELEARLGVQNGSVLGQILTPAGKPAAGVRVVALMAPDPAATAAAIQSVTNTGPDGRYLLEGLSPGRFNVAARTPSRPYDSLGARTFYPGVRSQSDAAVVTIGSGPTVPRIDFTLLPFIKVSGQIYTDGPVSRPADFDVASVGVIATPVANQFARTSTAQVQSDGSFILDGIDNETNYRIGLTISNGYLADARYGSDHPLKAPLALNEEGTLLHLMIRFDVARVEAPVTSDGRPFAGATAVLVPLDRTRRDLYRSAISNAQGTAVFTNVAPGDYTVFAWENPRDVDWMNPAFLKQFETSGRAERISKSTVSIDAIPIKP